MNENRKSGSLAEKLASHFARVPNLKLITLRHELSIAGNHVDADVLVETGGLQFEILMQLRSDGSPAIIRQAANHLKSVRRSVAGNPNLYLVVAAPYVSDAGMDVCKEEQIGCVDAAGNCYLSFDGVYIEIRGNKNPDPRKKSIKFLFSPKSSRVIRVLLSAPHRWWQVQEISREARISIGLVSRLKRRLLDEEFVVERERRLQLKDPHRLIDSWVDNYNYKRNPLNESHSLNDPPRIEKLVADYCGQRGINYALGLFSAASRLSPHVRMNRAFIFADGDIDSIARDLDFKPVSSGPNVVLLKPYDDGVFYGNREIDGLKVVSAIQAYIDLKTYKGRGEEAADHLMDQVLEPSWQQNQSMASVK
jgi:hypothetical protein